MSIRKTSIATLALAMVLTGVPIGMADEGTKSKTSEPSKERGSTDSQVAIDEAVASREDDKPEALGTVTRDNPNWEIVFDLDALAMEEGENWVWKGAVALRPDHTRCLMFLSRGGADATVVREFDLTTTSFVDDGFTLSEAK